MWTALWLLISHRFVKCCLGTAPIGGLYMPGRRSGLKEEEYLPSEISMSHCSHTNLEAGSSSVCTEKSKVIGSSLLITAYGHAPSLSEWHTKSTSGRFRCWHNRDSNLSTFIGVTILKSSG